MIYQYITNLTKMKLNNLTKKVYEIWLKFSLLF